MQSFEERNRVFEQHLKEEHHRSAFSDYFKEIIYGGVDGIVTTFAIVAGFSGAALTNETTTQLSFAVVLLFGFANLFADAASMGLGNFLSVRSEKDIYNTARKKELHEVTHNADLEYEETITVMMRKGYDEKDARILADHYKKNKTYWVDFMMNHELEMPDVRSDSAVFSGLATFFSFIVFGSIPIMPFVFLSTLSPQFVFVLSSIGTLIALLLLGLLKWRVIGNKLWKSVFEVVIVGGVAALIAFFVGSLFSV